MKASKMPFKAYLTIWVVVLGAIAYQIIKVIGVAR
jgi:hypothetical protein